MSNTRERNLFARMADKEITLPLNVKNFKKLLTDGSKSKSKFSHEAIVHWCYRFWWEYAEGKHREKADDLTRIAYKVADDVSVQWESFLMNNYTAKERENMEHTHARMPVDWFKDWLRLLKK